MSQVYLSIGSNMERERHISASLDALAERFENLQISPVYESEAVGFDGDNFYNLVVGFDTSLTVGDLARLLRQIEAANGRLRDGPKFSGRTLDIDILVHGDACGLVDGVELPRGEITENAYVLLPMADIASDDRLPGTGQTYGELWAAYNKAAQKLWRVPFDWRGQVL